MYGEGDRKLSENAEGGSGKIICHKNTASSEIEVFCGKCEICLEGVMK